MKQQKRNLIRFGDFQAYGQHKAEVAEEKEKRTGESTYKLWHQRIKNTLEWRKNWWNGDNKWREYYKMYIGQHWDQQQIDDSLSSDNPREFITVNVTGSTVQNFSPFLLNREPKFICKPRKPESIKSAIIQESVLNYEYHNRKMHQEIKKANLDRLVIGHGIVETGFTIEVDEGLTKADGEINYDDFITDEAPFVRRVNPHYFIHDITGRDGSLATARWAGKILFMPIPDIMVNSSFDKATLNKIKEGAYSIQTETWLMNNQAETGNPFKPAKDKESELGVLFEIWDKKFRKYYVFADGVEPPLIEKDWPYPYLREFPFKMCGYIPVPNQPYHVGLPYMLVDQQQELDRIRTTQFNHRRSFHRMYEVPVDLDESEKDKLQLGADGTLIEVSLEQSGRIKPIPPATITGDLYNTEIAIKEDIQQLTGSDELLQGKQLPSRTTVGEINARGNLFRAKLDDRVEDTDNWVVDIAEQVLAHIKANYLTDKVIRIAGVNGDAWEEFTPEDIQDPVDIEMESIAAPRTDPTLERQQALQMLQILTSGLQQFQQMGVQVNMQELLKWVLEKMGVSDAARFFPASALPLQVGSPQPQPPTPEQVNVGQTQQDVGLQAGLAPLLNQSGLQLS